jgi:hypothetical protein
VGEEFVRRIMVLGSVPSLGPVILFDDMEDLFKWTAGGTGGDVVHQKLTTDAFNGSACLHMKTRATGATAGDILTSQRYIFQRPGKRYQVECIFKLTDTTKVRGFDVGVVLFDGIYSHSGIFRYSGANSRWEYYVIGTGWVAVPGGSQDLGDAVWHRMALSFDENSGKFLSLVCDGKVVDVSSISYSQSGVVGSVYAFFYIGLTAETTTPPEAFVDDVLAMEI